MDDTVYIIALGGLVHDIGKFMQRAELENDFAAIREYYGEFCPLSPTKTFTHLHAAYSAFFIENFIPNGLFDKTELYNAARHHKNPVDDIYKVADIISAGMDRYDNEIENESYKKVRLCSIFDFIELQYSILDKAKNINPRWFYSLQPLQQKDISSVYPFFREKKEYEISNSNEYENQYRYLWTEFKRELDSIKHNNNPRLYFNELYGLLEKYTWCIPSATNAFPDISLFDHMKTTAAIATALYHYNQAQKTDEKEFIIYAGDISGIQDYIFRISHAQGIGGVAKRLRGRSFFINMLSEVLTRYILEDLGYTHANINFCGGGNFELLLANTPASEKFLTDFEKKLNTWLLNNFQGELGFISVAHKFSSKELERYYTKCKSIIDENINSAKLKKFENIIENPHFWVDSSEKNGHIRICPSCGIKVVKHRDEICESCKLDKKIGSALPTSSYISFRIGNIEAPEYALVSLDFGTFGAVDLIGNVNNDTTLWNIAKNSTNLYGLSPMASHVKARYPIATTLPYAIEAIEDLPSEKDEEGDTTVYPNQTLSFTTLAAISQGDKRIGILKMDVDNLGLIFAQGFPSTLSKALISISRIATLSRSLSIFFTNIIDYICDKIFKEWKEKTEWAHKEKISNIFYLTFSGGDDLLIVGPWDQIIELARRIRREFKRFTCENPNLSISAGIYICKPKYPVYMAVKKADEALHQSKAKGKNRITVMGETLVWDEEDPHSRIFQDALKVQFASFTNAEIREENIFLKGLIREKIQKTLTFEELINFGNKLLRDYEAKKISRKFIHRLLEAKEIFFQTVYNDLAQREEEDHNYMFIPYLLYSIERNVKIDEKADWKRILITEGNAERYVRQAKFPCKYALMKTRN